MGRKLSQGIWLIQKLAEKYTNVILQKLNIKSIKTINKRSRKKKRDTKIKKSKIFQVIEKNKNEKYKEQKKKKLDDYLMNQEKELDFQQNYLVCNKFFFNKKDTLFCNDEEKNISTILNADILTQGKEQNKERDEFISNISETNLLNPFNFQFNLENNKNHEDDIFFFQNYNQCNRQKEHGLENDLKAFHLDFPRSEEKKTNNIHSNEESTELPIENVTNKNNINNNIDNNNNNYSNVMINNNSNSNNNINSNNNNNNNNSNNNNSNNNNNNNNNNNGSILSGEDIREGNQKQENHMNKKKRKYELNMSFEINKKVDVLTNRITGDNEGWAISSENKKEKETGYISTHDNKKNSFIKNDDIIEQTVTKEKINEIISNEKKSSISGIKDNNLVFGSLHFENLKGIHKKNELKYKIDNVENNENRINENNLKDYEKKKGNENVDKQCKQQDTNKSHLQQGNITQNEDNDSKNIAGKTDGMHHEFAIKDYKDDFELFEDLNEDNSFDLFFNDSQETLSIFKI